MLPAQNRMTRSAEFGATVKGGIVQLEETWYGGPARKDTAFDLGVEFVF